MINTAKKVTIKSHCREKLLYYAMTAMAIVGLAPLTTAAQLSPLTCHLSEDGAGGERVHQGLLAHAEDGGDPLHVGVVRDVRGVKVVDHLPLVLDVAHVQQRRQDLQNVPDLVVGHHQNLEHGNY